MLRSDGTDLYKNQTEKEKQMASNRYENDSVCGVLPVFKESGMTSHDVVGRIRQLYGTRRVGHTGTLDPMARGVLVVLLGRAAKAAEFIDHERKHYVAGLRLGITTDTEDISGNVLECAEAPQNIDTEALRRQFTGTVMQVPPMYSAIKIGGRKLVDLAREGITVERRPRPITVYSLGMEKCTDGTADYILDVECSGGTYIRTLCADIGAAVGCGGCMSSLCRTENSGFTEGECVTLAQLGEMSQEERVRALRDTETLFSDLPAVQLPEFFARLASDGNSLFQKKIGCAFEEGTRVRLCDAHGFFSLGEARTADGEHVIKPVKKFRM